MDTNTLSSHLVTLECVKINTLVVSGKIPRDIHREKEKEEKERARKERPVTDPVLKVTSFILFNSTS